MEPPIGRVVYRGFNYAIAYGGVSDAYANSDASNANANVGSRLENQYNTIGVQHRGRVPIAVPREASLSNSTITVKS